MKKLLNKANPGEKAFNEFSTLIKEYKELFIRQVERKADVKELVEIMEEFIYNQDQDGYWRLIYSEDMPFDAKIEYWKYPTILFTSIMISFKLNHSKLCNMIKGFDETLLRALDIIERGKLTGHGYSSFNFKLSALKTLLQADVMKFIELYPEENKAFTDLIYSNRSEILKLLKGGKTRFDFNEEFSLRIEEVLNNMSGKKEVYLFVYGTLMKNNRHKQSYLDNADYKGECTLDGYSLYDLGYYPGIVEDEDCKVKGELYAIPQNKLPEIDIYEAEGFLYNRTLVQVYSEKHELVEAYVYIYNQSVTGKSIVAFHNQPWFEGVTEVNRNYVWYACYGSNINKERFMKYINGDKTRVGIHKDGCRDKTPPVEEKPYILEHPIYFANHSGRWDNKGVAFLDIYKKGRCYGKMYLITKEQFKEIHQQEGQGSDWYNEIVNLGFEDGIPIQTITHTLRYYEDTIPSNAYLDVIKKGIQDTYPSLKEVDIDAYLIEKYLDKDKINILTYLRNQDHGVTIQKITDVLNKDIKSVISIINDLKGTELIKQDGRSIRVGIAWDSSEAVYYTMPDRRDVIDKVLQ